MCSGGALPLFGCPQDVLICNSFGLTAMVSLMWASTRNKRTEGLHKRSAKESEDRCDAPGRSPQRALLPYASESTRGISWAALRLGDSAAWMGSRDREDYARSQCRRARHPSRERALYR